MPENKKAWFGRTDSDSDTETDSETDTDSTTDSSSGSGSTDSSSSSDSSSTAGNLPSKWIAGGADDSDSDDAKKGSKLMSKRDKTSEALYQNKQTLFNHLTNRDYGSMLDDLDRFAKIMKSADASRRSTTPGEYLSCLKALEGYFKENDDKKLKKKLNKLQAKNVSTLKHRTRKLCVDLREELDAYESDVSDSDSESSSELSELDAEDINARKPKRKTKKEKAEEKAEEEGDKKEEWTEEAITRKVDAILNERGKKSTRTDMLLERLKVILGHTVKWRHLTLYVLSVMLSCLLDRDRTQQKLQCMPVATWKQCYDLVTRVMNIIFEHNTIIAIDQDDEDRRAERKDKDKDDGEKGAFEKDGEKYRVYLSCTLHQVVDTLCDEYTKSLQYSDPHTHEYVSRLTDECYLVDMVERVHSYYKGQRRVVAANLCVRLMDVLYYRRKEDHTKMTEKQRQLTIEKHAGKKEADADALVAEEEEDEEAAQERADAEAKKEAEEKAKSRAEKLSQLLDRRTRSQKHWVVQGDLEDVMKNLHNYVYRVLNDHIGGPAKMGGRNAPIEESNLTRGLLYYVYHLALHDHYYHARDLLLMSRRYAEHEEHSKYVNSTGLMVLYNRCIAQLGLASFRAGEFDHTNTILNELAYNRTRECLAQAPVKNREKPENDIKEKLKLVPYHMHINIDVIEGTHLTAAVLREVPIRARTPHDEKRRAQSRSFQRLLNMFQSQVFIGPPETTKELIYAAFQSLQRGDWQKTNEFIMSLNMWSNIKDAERVKGLVSNKIKIEGLRTYLYTYSQYYTTVQLGELAVKYELPEEKVHAVVSKMILHQHITAAWDQPQQCICVEHNTVSKLQFLASQMTDKCSALMDHNEKRQAEKEERQGGRDDRDRPHHHRGGYHRGRRFEGGQGHRVGIQKSRQVDRSRHNAFERRQWHGKRQ